MLKIERDMERRKKAKKIDDDKTVALISYVQNKNCLWDVNHPDFKKSVITKKLWNEIGSQLNITGDEAKHKWQKLKMKFKKLLRTKLEEEKNKAELSSTAPSWKFFNSMMFLKDAMNLEPLNSTSSTTNNTSKTMNNGQPEENDNDFEEFDFDIFLPRSSVKDTSKNEEARSHKPGPRSSKRKITNKDETDDKNQEPEEKKVLISSPKLVHQDERKGNDDHHFLLSLMPYMQALDPVEKLELRSQIQNLVTACFKKHEVNKCSRKHH